MQGIKPLAAPSTILRVVPLPRLALKEPLTAGVAKTRRPGIAPGPSAL